jgi:deoxyribodipyrimidine photolyase
MTHKSIRIHYENMAWVSGSEEERRLKAWKTGKTGYPIVDSGMRELYATGWMTQSVRMVVASFLVEYLRINWTKGAQWFHETLVDADCAINSMMWQNAGRSGTDQWNFIMSPELASQDKSGSYTRKWVPELVELPNKYLHRPWTAPNDVLKDARVILGDAGNRSNGATYPARIVEDLKAERKISVENVLEMRKDAQEFNDPKGYDLIKLPDGGGSTVVFTKKEYRIDERGGTIENAQTLPRPSKRPKQSSSSRSGGRGRGRRG